MLSRTANDDRADAGELSLNVTLQQLVRLLGRALAQEMIAEQSSEQATGPGWADLQED